MIHFPLHLLTITKQGGKSSNPIVEYFVKERETVQQILKENLQKSPERMKLYADMKRSKREFQ